VDSSPGWDSTALTVAAITGSAGIIAAIAGERPWLWALLIGLPTPIVEGVLGGNGGSVLALGFAAVGATAGWAVGRVGR